MQLPILVRDAYLHYDGQPLPAIEILGIRYDSRHVRPGDLFVAVPGTATDGHRHVGAAVAAGAVAVVVERADACVEAAPCLVTPSSRRALADLAGAFYGFPARRLQVTGITGTDGKTTSTFLLSHLLEAVGRSTGLVGTVAIKIGPRWEENLGRVSTPEAPEVQAALRAMVDAHVTDAVLEATSHGLVLDRVRHCAFDAALVTNITSEHLDFHGTRERYLDAKALLLHALTEREGKTGPTFAAINADDEGSACLIPRSPAPVITFGLADGVALRAAGIVTNAGGSRFTLQVEGRELPVYTPLPGLFNVYNTLGVLAVIHGRGLPLEAAVQALPRFAGVPGRMRRVDAGQPFAVIVDYAHTADSLLKVLTTLRPLTQGKLIAVFGSAGDRDREKRPVMGGVAATYADFSVFTDEDPRTESPMAIIDAIAEGARATGAREGEQFQREPDRRAAIALALRRARPGDMVLLAGKGHEQSIITATGRVPWDEERVAREELAVLGYAGALGAR